MPGEGGALDAHGVFRHADERLQVAEVVRAEVGVGHHAREVVDERPRFLFRLPFHRLRHHRAGGLAEGAAAPLEADVGKNVALEVRFDGDLVAAERVVALTDDFRIGDGAVVPRPPVVVEDQVFVELVKLGFGRQWHFQRTSLLLVFPPPGRRLLRAGCRGRSWRAPWPTTPSRLMSGCAQWWPARMAMPVAVEDGADVMGVNVARS